MKPAKNLRFRVKLLLAFVISIVVVTVVITLAMSMRSYRYISENLDAQLDLIAEQTLMNFYTETSAISSRLLNQLNVNEVPEQLYRLNEGQAELTLQYTRGLTEALSRMITASTGYDSVYVRMPDGTSFSNPFVNAEVLAEEAGLMERYGVKTYGRPVWLRSETGSVYLLRDIYNLQPFRFTGKVLARLSNPAVISLGEAPNMSQCAVAFFHNDQLVTLAGGIQQDTEGAALRAAAGSSIPHTLISQKKRGAWTAMALLPDSVLSPLYQSVLRMGLAVSLAGILLGAAAVFIATRNMTRQISTLSQTVDEAAAGDMTVRAPVVSQDETGRLAVHFNAMVESNQKLMDRLVQEEKQKNRAAYDALEYKYRSLQSQINPHFIYNALEVVNAMAKLDNEPEICDVVSHISSFFRQNTRNMEKRFITVQREFASLKEYAYIFCHIYGSLLQTPFECAPEAEQAMIPTMILQPVLENALVHGVRREEAVVSITASCPEEGRLSVRVQDNGVGMSQELIDRILTSDEALPEHDGKKSAGIGLRNVRDRLQLIYSDRASLSIESGSQCGTAVTISLPLSYQEESFTEPD